MAADDTARAKLSSADGFLQEGMTAENLPGICASLSLKAKPEN
jgi:hypothetical protein